MTTTIKLLSMQPKLRSLLVTFSVILLSFVSNFSFAQTGTAILTSDKQDYAPNSTAVLTGTGFKPGETVTVQVVDFLYMGEPTSGDNATNDLHQPWEVTADASGSFVTPWYVDQDEVWITLKATATGKASGLVGVTYFTDAATGTISVTPTTSGTNSVLQYTFTIKNTTPTPANESTSANINSVKLTLPSGYVVPTLPSGVTSYISNIQVLDASGNIVTDPTRVWQVYTGGSGNSAFIEGYNDPNEFAIQVNNTNGALRENESVRFTLYIQNPSTAGNYTWNFNVYANANVNGASFNAPNPSTNIVACSAPTVNTSGQPSNQSITYGDNAIFTFSTSSAAYQWQVNTGSGFVNIADGGVYSGATTNQLTLTNPTVSMSGYQYKCIASACSPIQSTNSSAALLTVAKKELTVTADNKSKTYDGQTFTAGGGTFTSTITGFAGTETLATSGVSGSVTYSGAALAAIDASITPYTITPIITGLSAMNYSFTAVNGRLTINKASVCVTYNGDLFKNTTSLTGGTAEAKISIIVTKSPITASGTLATANVTLKVDNVTYSNDPLASNKLTVAVISKDANNNPTAIEYSFKRTLDLGNSYSNTWDITWTIGGNYQVNEDCSDDYAQITVSSMSTDFATGGGYITNVNSQGIIRIAQNEVPSKNNFGFDIKWNKAQTSFQGHFNTIIRSGGRSYQVKSSNPASILTYKTSTGFRSTITYTKANIQDLTSMLTGTCIPGPVWQKCSDGNGTVVLTIEDNGEPGSTGTSSNDRYAITVKDKNGVLFYASNIAGPTGVSTLPTAFKLLSGGNIQIRSTTKNLDPNDGVISSYVVIKSAGTKFETIAEDPSSINNSSIVAYPNPTQSQFNIKLQSSNTKDAISIKVYGANGNVVEQKQHLAAGQTIQLGALYRPGVYILEMIQGKQHKQIKLVKIPD